MKKIALLLSLLTFTLCNAVGANTTATTVCQDDSTTLLLRQQNELLKEQIALLRQQNEALLDQTDSLADVTTNLNKEIKKTEEKISRMPKVSGFMQLLYEGNKDIQNINVKRARVSVSGALAKNLTYKMQVEFASPKILDFFMAYQPYHQFGVMAGMFKLPFGIENSEYSPLIVETIDLPLALAKLMGYDDLCGMKNTGRDLGVNFQGGFFPHQNTYILNYDLGLYNGNGITVKDDNKRKDLSGRIMIKPVKYLKIAGTGYWGTFGPEAYERSRWGAAVAWDHRLILRAEYIGGKTDNAISRGCFAVAGAHLPYGFTLVARYDFFHQDINVYESRIQDCVVGLAWDKLKHFRVQFNYNFTNYFGEADNTNNFSVMFTGKF
ncbi:MAG: porin [Bacteroidales bacterium]|nr:porin [Bacteroidales bacterium]